MKNILALATLSSKLLMLLCMSGMGFLSIMQEVSAEAMHGCHEVVVETEDTTPVNCDMCVEIDEEWSDDGVTTTITEIVEVHKMTIEVAFATTEVFPVIHAGTYEAYYPPPQVALKAVTPNTKTIVFLS